MADVRNLLAHFRSVVAASPSHPTELEVLGVIVAIIALLIGVPPLVELIGNFISDRGLSRRIDLLEKGQEPTIKFPRVVRRRMQYRYFKKVLKLFAEYMEKIESQHFDAYLGVSVSGMWAAAELSNSGGFHPLLHLEVEFRHGQNEVRKVTPHFDLAAYRGKHVLVVDNSIKTGETLHKTLELLADSGISATSCVIYRKSLSDGGAEQPDYVVLRGRSPRPLPHWLK